MNRFIIVATAACAFGAAAYAQSTPKPPATGGSMKDQVRQQMKLLGDKEKSDMSAFNDKARAVRDAASAQIKPLEEQLKVLRDKMHLDVAAIEDQERAARAGYETQRDALMESVESGYTARRQTLVAQLKTLDDQMAADIAALDAQEKQEIDAVRAKDQGQRKAIRDGYAQKKRQVELDARAKK